MNPRWLFLIIPLAFYAGMCVMGLLVTASHDGDVEFWKDAYKTTQAERVELLDEVMRLRRE